MSDNTLTAPAATPPQWLRMAVWALLLAAASWLLIQQAWIGIDDLLLPDNDDGLRFLQVRDLLAGQSWWDVTQHRLNPPDGGDMHWSRLGDLPMLAIAGPLSLFLPVETAVKIAALAAPPVLGILTAAILLVALDRTAGRAASIAAALAILTAPGLATVFQPGRVDHHGLQVLCLALALVGAGSRDWRMGALAGVAVAASLVLGLELAPVLLVLCAAVAGLWVLGGPSTHTRAIFLGLAGGLCVLVGLTIPMSDWTARHHDAFSLIHIAPAMTGALVLAAASFVPARGPWQRLGLLTFAGVASLTVALQFPELLKGPYADVDPFLKQAWLDNIKETRPYWSSELSGQLGYGLFPLLALVAGLCLLAVDLKVHRDVRFLAICLVALGLTSFLSWFWQLRVIGQAHLVAVPVVALVLARVWETRGRLSSLGLGAVILPVLPMLAGVAAHRMAEPATTTAADSPTVAEGRCNGSAALAALSGLPKGRVLAPIDLGAQVLLATHHETYAAPYHRNWPANLAAWRAFMAAPEQAGPMVRAIGADYVAICTLPGETELIADEAPDGLITALQAGRTPAWLAPVAIPPGSAVRVWTVIQN